MARPLVVFIALTGIVVLPCPAQNRVGPKVRIAMTEVEWDPGVRQTAFMRGGNSPTVMVSEQQTFARGLTEMMIAEHDNPSDFDRFSRVSAAAMRAYAKGER